MKKILSILVALLIAAPAMAGVTITCQETDAPDPCGIVEIRFQVDNPGDLARAFALDISVTDGNVSLSPDQNDLDPNYWVYPGQITIVDGNVTDQGLPVASGNGALSPPSGLTIEMASLYASGATPPDVNGVLCKVITTENCTVNITGNATRGNAVMESGASVEVSASGAVTRFFEGCACRGDVDNSGKVSPGDMASIVAYVSPAYATTSPPYTCTPVPAGDECYDVNLDDKISPADMAAIIAFVSPAYATTTPPYTYTGCMP